MFRTLPSRDELARLDSFALGEAVAARLRVMNGDELRAFATSTEARSDGYYKAELARALQENPTDDVVLADSLAAFFRANPRAIDRCDPAFLASVLQSLDPHDGEVAIEEDDRRRNNPVMLGAGLALLLVGAGAAIDRAVTSMHATSYATPPPIVVYVTPQPAAHAVAHRAPQRHAPRAPRHVASAPRQTPAPRIVSTTQTPHPAHRAHARVKPKSAHKAKHPITKPSAAPARRVVKYPVWRTPPAHAQSLAVHEPTPKPRTWLQRQLDRINPFKKRPVYPNQEPPQQ